MSAGLSDLLFSNYRRRVLGLLLLNPKQQYHVREIARLTGTVAGTLHKELSRLARAGVLVSETVGNQRLYQASPSCPIFEELVSILQKLSANNNKTSNKASVMDALVENTGRGF